MITDLIMTSGSYHHRGKDLVILGKYLVIMRKDLVVRRRYLVIIRSGPCNYEIRIL